MKKIFESLFFSIDTKQVLVALYLTSQCFIDVRDSKIRISLIFAENMLIFKFSPKILGMCDCNVPPPFVFVFVFCFLFFCFYFWLIMKEMTILT